MSSSFATATHRLSPSVLLLSDRITRQRVGSTQQLVLAGTRWGGSSARRRDVRPPRRPKSMPGNGDAAFGNDAALYTERAALLRAQAGPWASATFNRERTSPLRDLRFSRL